MKSCGDSLLTYSDVMFLAALVELKPVIYVYNFLCINASYSSFGSSAYSRVNFFLKSCFFRIRSNLRFKSILANWLYLLALPKVGKFCIKGSS